jgi:UDP-N-acetylglucosamine acyltransferase
MINKIHPTAIIDSTAVIAEGVEVGPYSIIGPQVSIGEGSWIGPHVVVKSHTKIGKGNKIYQFASIGEDPQDLSYKEGDITYLEIGDNNNIRENVTIHRGTLKDKGLTKMGSGNLLMAYTHIAHDCIVGNHAIFANAATLGGHVIVEDYATVGAFCAVHQFVRIGPYSYSARACQIVHDVSPYLLVVGNTAEVAGINKVGLLRKGFSKETIKILWNAYQVLYRQNHTLKEALEMLAPEGAVCSELQTLLDFIKNSEEKGRGILRKAIRDDNAA